MKPPSNDAREARNTSAEELPRNIDGAVEGPTMVRRSLAKAIDFVAVGFTVIGFTAFTHSWRSSGRYRGDVGEAQNRCGQMSPVRCEVRHRVHRKNRPERGFRRSLLPF
jgi:hypothetical protein